jgi:Asp-tRNA(Asn)/Glu-tRNA(Gln) amidotransferase A subunit family amidase
MRGLLPVVTRERLPVGMQIIAAPWREDICLRVAKALEDAGLAASPVAAERIP